MKRFLSITTLVLMAFAAYGSPVKSDLAAKGIELEDNGAYIPTAADYIQDGLIAMWDGIENAGWGVHDANATQWKDLSGNDYDLTLTSHGSWDGDALVVDGVAYAASATVGIMYTSMGCCLTKTGGSAVVFFAGAYSSASERANRSLMFMGPSGPKYIQFNGIDYFSSPSNNDGANASVACNYRNASVDYAFSNGERLTISTPKNAWGQESPGRFAIGGGTNYSLYLMKGKVHNIRLYSRALTAEEIQYNYYIDKMRFGL